MKTNEPRAFPFFLDVEGRSLLCIHHAPSTSVSRGAVIYLPPFAEELNKSRRMVNLQARALAEAGWHVILFDPTGCGDSSGDFVEAGWHLWLEDIRAVRHWVKSHCSGPLWFWGLRAGALLACASLENEPEADCGLLLWQPVVSGSLHLQQFLRIKLAADMVGAARNSGSTASLLDDLRSGKSLEVAGYELPPAVALPMAEASLTLPSGVNRVRWIELSQRSDAGLNPASARIADAWKIRTSVDVSVVPGPGFWQTQEIEEAPELLQVTTKGFVA